MKKLILLSVVIFSNIAIFAQSVGIGTSNPNPSAVLDLTSASKGVLFPRIYLNNLIDNNAVSSPASSLVIYNTNGGLAGGAGLYYNANTPASPNWTKVGEMKLPYYTATSVSNNAFFIQNYGAGSLSNAIKGHSENGTALFGNSNNGTGVFASSINGTALEVSGRFKISGNDQSPALGKVLTSDADGNASWQGAIAFCSRSTQSGGASEFTSGVEKKIPFLTEEYDYGNNYNPSTASPYSTFTAPVKGIYHFDIKIVWFDGDGGAGHIKLKTVFNGVSKVVTQDLAYFNNNFTQNNINTDVSLEAGTQVYVTATQNTGSTIHLATNDLDGSGYPSFSGRLVIKL